MTKADGLFIMALMLTQLWSMTANITNKQWCHVMSLIWIGFALAIGIFN